MLNSLIIIKNSIKYNRKKIILKSCNKNKYICLYLLKHNIIKNFQKNKKIIILDLNFYKNKPINKQPYFKTFIKKLNV